MGLSVEWLSQHYITLTGGEASRLFPAAGHRVTGHPSKKRVLLFLLGGNHAGWTLARRKQAEHIAGAEWKVPEASGRASSLLQDRQKAPPRPVCFSLRPILYGPEMVPHGISATALQLLSYHFPHILRASHPALKASLKGGNWVTGKTNTINRENNSQRFCPILR